MVSSGPGQQKSTRICHGQLWSRETKVNQDLPWSALVQGNQSQQGISWLTLVDVDQSNQITKSGGVPYPHLGELTMNCTHVQSLYTYTAAY